MTHVSFEQRISTEEELRELLGYPSELVRQKVINHLDRHCREFEECYVHCAKSLKRSRLWQTDTWPDLAVLPNPAKMLADHANLPGVTVEKVAEALSESYTQRLY